MFRAALATALLLTLAGPAITSAACAQKAWTPPRDAYGHPDLSGVWTNTSITTLERTDPSLPLMLTKEQTARLEKQRATIDAADAAPTNPNAGAPTDKNTNAGYNRFWIDGGLKIGVVKGAPRSSWIIDPADGRLPWSDDGKKRAAAIMAKRADTDPEGMNPADRCLVGSRGSGGPPMLNNLYNNTYQIVQTRDDVVIDVEMMHDARIVHMASQHRPAALAQWLGDSIGHWEGDTLVVETRGWKRDHGDYEPVRLSEKATVTERFTRTGPNEITYEFAVDDPGFYSRPWKGEMVFTPSNGPVYEYACHEGNYALEHILSGARIAEAKRR